ncbi:MULTISPECIES: hypothetical protein [Empedobacter]|uniref:hypothetical protein n=1 Tax=Empedobacter TaxID=59734 RepID=UPI00244BE6A6|nr:MULTISPECIES: hypothetical protein [Empedobacter]MDH1882802.1 hypothetical protein [Empedobacter sp. GD03797]MDM1043169.1 hypothetical protein [Empedobacter brevis]MDM1137086.1 hypothetical protein [Empedobacter sp. R750]
MSKQKSKLFYLATVGILSYVVADIIHEVIGHGGTSLIIGNKIELLTSVYFKSSPGNIFVDIGGPIANLIFGGFTFYILTRKSFDKLFLFQVTAYNLFWLSGTILHSAISKTGDWTFAVKEVVGEPYAKILLIFTGILFYFIILRVLNFYLSTKNNEQHIEPLTKKNIFYSFIFASVAAFVAGLFFQSDRLHSALEGLLEMASSLPILFLKFGENSFEESYKSKPNYFLELIVIIIYIAFCLTLGKGIT